MKNDKDIFFFQMVCVACLIAIITLLFLINQFLQ
jgi:hypothetical protein